MMTKDNTRTKQDLVQKHPSPLDSCHFFLFLDAVIYRGQNSWAPYSFSATCCFTPVHTHLRIEQSQLLLWSSRATEGTVPSLRPHFWLLSKVTLNVFSCFLPCFRLNCSISKVTSSVLTNTTKQTVDPQEATPAGLLKTTSLFIYEKTFILYGVVVAHRI